MEKYQKKGVGKNWKHKNTWLNFFFVTPPRMRQISSIFAIFSKKIYFFYSPHYANENKKRKNEFPNPPPSHTKNESSAHDGLIEATVG